MAMRITTGMAMNTYRYNLQNSTANVSDARNKVLTHRQFQTFAEAPTSATQAWRIRQAMRDNSNYQVNNSNTASRFNIAWATMGMIKTDLETAADEADIRARNDASATARIELGKILNDTADSVIQAMNSAKYGDHFVFSGDDEMNTPFSWSDDGKTLYYRGVNVNAGMLKDPASDAAIPSWAKDALGNVLTLRREAELPAGMPESSDDPDEQQWIDYYNDYKAALENGDTLPTEPITTAISVPDWAKDANGDAVVPATEDDLPKNMPESSENPDEQAWIDYYKQCAEELEQNGAVTTATQPAIYDVPHWARDGATGNSIVPELSDDYKLPAGMPESSDDVYEQAWMKYYNDLKTAMDNAVAAGEDPDAAAAEVTKPTEVPAWSNPDAFGVPEEAKKVDATDENTTAYEKMWAAYYLDQADVQRLEQLSAEYENVDLGMGLQEDENGVLINGTSFNRALPGINMLGYGVDEDGDPVNIVMIMKRLGEIYGGCDSESGKFSTNAAENEALTAEADRLMNKFQAATDRTNSAYTDIDTKAHYLQQNQSRLKLQGDYLQEERAEIEDVDLADAITEFSWDYYCYSAALKVGTQLLSQSLIDYMS